MQLVGLHRPYFHLVLVQMERLSDVVQVTERLAGPEHFHSLVG